jgi:hypothetical protein
MMRMNGNSSARNGARMAPLPRQIIPADKLPNQEQIMQILESMTAATTGRTAVPEAEPVFPPALPNYLLKTEYADMSTVGLQNEDLDTSKAIRQQNLQRLLTAAQISHYRAIGLNPPMQYRAFAIMSKLDKKAPEMDRGKPIVTGPAIDPVKFIKFSIDNRDVIQDKASTVGIPIIPDFSHANDCQCQALYSNAHYESLQTVHLCVPKELYKAYSENPKWPNCYEMGFAAPMHKNFSDIYYSEVSKSGTVLPQLVRRCPVSQMTRSTPVLKRPQFADINIYSSETLAAAIAAQLQRGEIRQFTKYLNEDPHCEEEHHITRFPTISRELSTNVDVHSYGKDIKSMEDIMINEPLVEAFRGKQSCEFCPKILNIQTETCFLMHLITDHKSLLHARFTCPACLTVEIYSASNYWSHYNHRHAKTTSLMYVLSETNVHVRMQHAHLLNMFIFMSHMMNVTTEKVDTEHYVSSIGGYTMGDEATLAMEVMELQLSLLPETFQPKSLYPTNGRGRNSRSESPEWTSIIRRNKKLPARVENVQTIPSYKEVYNQPTQGHQTVYMQDGAVSTVMQMSMADNVPYYAKTAYKPMTMADFPLLQREEKQPRTRHYTITDSVETLITKQNSMREPREGPSPPAPTKDADKTDTLPRSNYNAKN